MDAAELKKRARAARTFTFEQDGFGFTCVLPSDLEVRVAHAEASSGEVALQRVTRAAIVGWTGVRVEHVLADAPPEVARNALDFEPEWVEEFFAPRGQLFYALMADLFVRVKARREAIESAEKNSASTLT